MSPGFIFLCVCYVFSMVSCAPTNDGLSSRENPANNNSSSFEGVHPDHFDAYIRYGDMILPKDFFKNSSRTAIPGPYDKTYRWPNGRVPYVIDPSLAHATSQLHNAMNEYHRKTCVRFVPRTNEQHYITIFAGQGCYSHVGYNRLPAQPISLGNGCLPAGTIVHEYGHALGLFHEQNRSDRDDYLSIHWENIQQGYETQFQKLEPHENWLITGFDYNSIMMYGETAFSNDGYSKTMTADNGVTLHETYEKPGLTPSDARRINKMYDC